MTHQQRIKASTSASSRNTAKRDGRRKKASSSRCCHSFSLRRFGIIVLYSYWFGFFLHLLANLNQVQTVQVVNPDGKAVMTEDGQPVLGYLVSTPASLITMLFFSLSAVYALYKVAEAGDFLTDDRDDGMDDQHRRGQRPLEVASGVGARDESCVGEDTLRSPLLTPIQIV